MTSLDKMIIILIGPDGRTVFDKKISSLPLKEEVVVSKSVEFFSDPEPCMIHRSAVMKRLFAEMADYFEKAGAAGGAALRLDWAAVPEFVRRYINIKEDIKTLFVNIK